MAAAAGVSQDGAAPGSLPGGPGLAGLPANLVSQLGPSLGLLPNFLLNPAAAAAANQSALGALGARGGAGGPPPSSSRSSPSLNRRSPSPRDNMDKKKPLKRPRIDGPSMLLPI